jgi:hypothetical protein
VHVFDADRTAVSVAQALNDFGEWQRGIELHRFAREALSHVRFAEVIECRIEFWWNRTGAVQGINLRHDVTTQSIGADELVHAILETR